MADNVVLDPGAGGATIKTDDDGTAHWQYVKAAFGADNTQTRVTSSVGLPTDPLDRAALARSIPPLEHDDQAGVPSAHPLLHRHQLRLQSEQFLLVSLSGQPLARPVLLHTVQATRNKGTAGSMPQW